MLLQTCQTCFHLLNLERNGMWIIEYFHCVTEDDFGDNDEDNWSSFNQNCFNGNDARSTSYIYLETIQEETSDDLRTDSEQSSDEGNSYLYFLRYK